MTYIRRFWAAYHHAVDTVPIVIELGWVAIQGAPCGLHANISSPALFRRPPLITMECGALASSPCPSICFDGRQGELGIKACDRTGTRQEDMTPGNLCLYLSIQWQQPHISTSSFVCKKVKDSSYDNSSYNIPHHCFLPFHSHLYIYQSIIDTPSSTHHSCPRSDRGTGTTNVVQRLRCTLLRPK